MKFNIAYPTTGAQKTIEVDDERKIRNFIDKRLASEVDGEALGDQFKGYVFKIAGGFDKQGFTMKQGVLVPGRVRLLLGKNTSCYKPRRKGERKRKSVRGCIVSNEISVLNLVIVKKGAEELPGLTDKSIPRRLGPKRASKIRKLFNLSKEDDVRKYVIRRELVPKPPKEGEEPKKETKKSDKKRTKAPKIQRLVTPLTLQRKRHRIALKKKRTVNAKAAAAEYAKLLTQRAKEARASVLSKRRSVLSAKEGSAAAGKEAPKGKASTPAAVAKGAAAKAPAKDAKAAASAKAGGKPAAAPAAGGKAAAKGKDAPKTAKTAAPKGTAAPAAKGGKAAATTAPKATTTPAAPKASKPAAPKAAEPKAAAPKADAKPKAKSSKK